MTTDSLRLTAYSHGAGCACKLGPSDLAHVLRRLGPNVHPDLLIGTEWGDDAAVWRRPDGRALVATVDFFTPIVDDARSWGAIAAANAASDVYAMGGTPMFALNVVAWPQASLPLDLLGDVLEGGREIADAGGWLVVGGHSVDGAEPLYGQAVIGEAAAERLLSNAGGQAGQVLILTKALGTGLVATALKRAEAPATATGGWLEPAYRAALTSMTRLNATAGRVALSVGASAATDVTGFGLLGHLHKLALASGLAAEVDVDAVPRLPGVDELLAAEYVPGGTARNLRFVESFLASPAGARPGPPLDLLADPQTSGGLLFACPPAAADDAVAELRAGGEPAAVVGRLVPGPAGRISLR